NVLEISELGLVEMTRKRVRQDLRALLSTVCPTCKGNGVTKADATLAAEIFRAIPAKVRGDEDARGRDVVAQPLDPKITVQPNHADREGYEVRLRGGATS